MARGGEHGELFDVLGLTDWRDRMAAVEDAYGGFRPDDLYPDALPALAQLADAGYRLAVLANQPAPRTAELAALGIRPNVMAMSGEMGVHKPDPAFFDRSLELMGHPDPACVAYVGDRIDNDVRASAAAGMRAVWLRRGPWGHLQSDDTRVATLTVRSLAELVDRHREIW